ncbi:hypothetical protein M8940_10165 [Pasteurella multocida]|uniref:hypothetical protein n=1 Tax=Pasteurella multocida TaxID=747 RepID=UPI002021756D|nr:hypothetical protein [Pasteurella multocida]MCL7776899.1 hypothetical protein [Pasteurella multocida]
MDREYLSDLALSLTLKINNDTNQALDASSDMLWQYEVSPSVSVMTKGFELDDILK